MKSKVLLVFCVMALLVLVACSGEQGNWLPIGTPINFSDGTASIRKFSKGSIWNHTCNDRNSLNVWPFNLPMLLSRKPAPAAC